MMKDLLQKYLDDKVSMEERQLILRWIKESAANQKEYNVLKARHVAGTLNQATDSYNKTAYSLFKGRQSRKKRSRYIKYTAIAVLLISTGFFLHTYYPIYEDLGFERAGSQVYAVHSGNETQKKVVLPDGSVVQLNIDSSIRYPNVFGNGERTVTLMGEALFDIVHDSLRPFVVRTADYDVKVLGTVFNVKSYTNDTQTETTLISGEVELLREKETPIILAPSQKAVFHKTEKKMKIGEVISEDVIAWQKGSLVFNSTPMQQVALDLERKYNVQITINSPKLLVYEYTGTFDNLTLEESLQLLMISSPINYEILKNKIVLNMKE